MFVLILTDRGPMCFDIGSTQQAVVELLVNLHNNIFKKTWDIGGYSETWIPRRIIPQSMTGLFPSQTQIDRLIDSQAMEDQAILHSLRIMWTTVRGYMPDNYTLAFSKNTPRTTDQKTPNTSQKLEAPAAQWFDVDPRTYFTRKMRIVVKTRKGSMHPAEVDPQAKSIIFSDGIINYTHRESWGNRGEIWTIDKREITDRSHRFQKGYSQ